MKKICLLIVLCFVGISIHAQVQWGVKAGVNMSKWSQQDANIADPETHAIMYYAEDDYAVGFSVGGTMNYQFNKSFSLQPELLFSLLQSNFKGELHNSDFGTEKSVIRYQNFYLQLPVNLKYSIELSNNNSVQLLAGPYIGYGLFGGVFFNGENVNSKIFDFTDRLDYGLNFGLGYEINHKYTINASYLLGLKEINPLDSKWSSFQLSVGYLF